MAGHDRLRGAGQLAVEQMQIGAAHPARGDAHAQLARPRSGSGTSSSASGAPARAIRSGAHAGIMRSTPSDRRGALPSAATIGGPP